MKIMKISQVLLDSNKRGRGLNKQGDQKIQWNAASEIWINGELFVYFDPNDVMYQDFPMYKQSCNLWKGKKCWSNVKFFFSDSNKWPGKLKVEIKY